MTSSHPRPLTEIRARARARRVRAFAGPRRDRSRSRLDLFFFLLLGLGRLFLGERLRGLLGVRLLLSFDRLRGGLLGLGARFSLGRTSLTLGGLRGFGRDLVGRDRLGRDLRVLGFDGAGTE
jgi:hypothetical protein